MAVAEGVTSYFLKENVASTLNERCGVTRVCGQLVIIQKEIVSTLFHLVWIDMEEPSSARDTPQFSIFRFTSDWRTK